MGITSLCAKTSKTFSGILHVISVIMHKLCKYISLNTYTLILFWFIQFMNYMPLNKGIRILPLPSANGILGEGMSGYRSGKLFFWMGNYPWRRMNHKLANGMKMGRGNGNTTTLLFSLKKLEIVHLETRGHVKTIVMEHFNGILFHKSGPANKQHTNQSINQIKEKGCDCTMRFHLFAKIAIRKHYFPGLKQ